MKELADMSLEELWALFPIIIKDHNENYREWYIEEIKRLEELIGTEKIDRTSHIGSSAVQGLLSKPTIDILLEINENIEIECIKKSLIENGWILMSSSDEPYLNYVFNKGYTKAGFAERVYHLHVRTKGDWDELYFRDYLIDNDDIAEKYGQLKLDLQSKHRNNRDAYTKNKSGFVKKYTNIARNKYKNRYK